MHGRSFQPWGIFPRPVPGVQGTVALAVFLLLLCFVSLVRADATPASSDNFGQYIVNHQKELAPFFDKNSGEFVARAVPYVLEWLSRLTLAALFLGWLLDMVLSRGFAMLFAPLLGQPTRCFVYATGRLVLSIILTATLGLVVILVAGVAHLLTVLLVLGLVFVLIGVAVQVGWIYYLYHTDLVISSLFFLTLVVVHGFLALAITVPMIGARAGSSTTGFVDHTVTPRLQAEVAAAKQELAATIASRDDAANSISRAQDQVDQAKAEEAEVQSEIDEQKNSPAYLFSQIVKIHARGDLTTARERFKNFLAQFPNGSLTGLAKGQLTQIDNELAAQEAQKKADDAAVAKAEAQARADLLNRANRGEATLSEMRKALIGKTRKEVGALFGPPTETASDRWGYGGEIVTNPLTNEKSGLAIYFTEGTVQGVDYYYGAPK